MTPVRVAVVGLGAIAQSVHLPVVQRNRAEIDLVALAEASPSRRAAIGRRYGVPLANCFATARDLAAAIEEGHVSVDAAVVATPWNHADDALALIRSGVRVLAEKPLAYSFADLDHLETSLIELGREPREWLRVGYMKEYDPAVVEASGMLSAVTPREVSIVVLHPANDTQLQFARLPSPATDVDPDLLTRTDEEFQRSISIAVGNGDETLRKLYSQVVLGSVIHDIALARHLGFALAEVALATRWGDDFPGSLIGAGATDGHVPFTIHWHFIKDYPEYRELFTVHHERGSIELEFKTPYILNAPTILRTRSASGDLHDTQLDRSQFPSSQREKVWPQQEAFESQFTALVAMTRGSFPAGSSIDAARQDLASAQALWRACALSAGAAVDATCEAAKQRHRGIRPDGDDSKHPRKEP